MELAIVQTVGYDFPKMAQDERAKLLERRTRLDNRLKQLAMQEQAQKRKDDARRKIIAGALVLEHMTIKADFAAELIALLNRYVTRPQDRALFEFLDDRVPDVTPAVPAASDSFKEAGKIEEKDQVESA